MVWNSSATQFFPARKLSTSFRNSCGFPTIPSTHTYPSVVCISSALRLFPAPHKPTRKTTFGMFGLLPVPAMTFTYPAAQPAGVPPRSGEDQPQVARPFQLHDDVQQRALLGVF